VCVGVILQGDDALFDSRFFQIRVLKTFCS